VHVLIGPALGKLRRIAPARARKGGQRGHARTETETPQGWRFRGGRGPIKTMQRRRVHWGGGKGAGGNETPGASDARNGLITRTGSNHYSEIVVVRPLHV